MKIKNTKIFLPSALLLLTPPAKFPPMKIKLQSYAAADAKRRVNPLAITSTSELSAGPPTPRSVLDCALAIPARTIWRFPPRHRPTVCLIAAQANGLGSIARIPRRPSACLIPVPPPRRSRLCGVVWASAVRVFRIFRGFTRAAVQGSTSVYKRLQASTRQSFFRGSYPTISLMFQAPLSLLTH